MKRNIFSREKITKAVLLISSLVFLYLFIREGSKIDYSRLLHFYPLILVLISLSFLHMSLKSFVMFHSAKSLNFNEPFSFFFKSYCMSTYVEIATLSGKVGSDAFKYMYWKKASRSQRVNTILLFRLSGLPAACYSLVFVFYQASSSWLWILVIFLLTLFIVLRIKRKMHTNSLKGVGASLLLTSHVQMLALVVSLTQFYLSLVVFEVSEPFRALSVHITSSLVGALSLLPLGLGSKDLAILVQMKQYVPTATILAILVLQRVTGEFVTAATGGFISLREMKVKNV